MTVETLPASLYKFLDVNGVNRVLEDGTLKFSLPTAFNDPLESRIDVGDIVDRERFIDLFCRRAAELMQHPPATERIEHRVHARVRFLESDRRLARPGAINQLAHKYAKAQSRQRREFFAADDRDQYGAHVLCMSRLNSSVPMWAHYAEKHAGAVVEFRPEILFEGVSNLLSGPVRYSYELVVPRQNEEFWVKTYTGEPVDEPMTDYHRVIFTKGQDWAYENEFRFVIPRTRREVERIQLAKFVPEALTAVYFGLATKPSDVDAWTKLARIFNPRCCFRQAVLRPPVFGLTFDELH